ncbi:MAG: VanZ family protein [Planctomycetota bacterium]
MRSGDLALIAAKLLPRIITAVRTMPSTTKAPSWTQNLSRTMPWAGVGESRGFTYAKRMIRIATMLLCVYWIGICVATHLPSKALPGLKVSDKLCHAVAFAGLAFLMAWAIPAARDTAARFRHALLVLGLVVAYGIIDENTQRFIPGRHCDIWDMAADIVGAVIGLSCYLGLRGVLLRQSWGKRLIDRMSFSVPVIKQN